LLLACHRVNIVAIVRRITAARRVSISGARWVQRNGDGSGVRWRCVSGDINIVLRANISFCVDDAYGVSSCCACWHFADNAEHASIVSATMAWNV
jgi:hypothetical protein